MTILKRRYVFACLVLLHAILGCNCANAQDLWQKGSSISGLPKGLLFKLCSKESGIKYPDGIVRPYPYTLRVNDEGFQRSFRFNSKSAAESALTALMRAGRKSIDIGACQINTLYHGGSVADPLLLLDARTNVFVAAQYLRELLVNANGDIELAVRRYHSFNELRGKAYARDLFERFARSD